MLFGSIFFDWNKGWSVYYNFQGAKLNGQPILLKSSAPRVISWHPIRQIAAVGWDNGQVFIWNVQEQESYEIPSLHTKKITTLCWSSSGSILSSGDSVRIFIFWISLSQSQCSKQQHVWNILQHFDEQKKSGKVKIRNRSFRQRHTSYCPHQWQKEKYYKKWKKLNKCHICKRWMD